MGEQFKAVSWRVASKYTKRAVFWRRESTGEYLRVLEVRRRGPNIRVRLADGREFEADRARLFYAHTTKGS